MTGGQAHDCPLAERLIRRVKPAKRTLGDKAYDSAELREAPPRPMRVGIAPPSLVRA